VDQTISPGYRRLRAQKALTGSDGIAEGYISISALVHKKPWGFAATCVRLEGDGWRGPVFSAPCLPRVRYGSVWFHWTSALVGGRLPQFEGRSARFPCRHLSMQSRPWLYVSERIRSHSITASRYLLGGSIAQTAAKFEASKTEWDRIAFQPRTGCRESRRPLRGACKTIRVEEL